METNKVNDIFAYITQEETNYMLPVPVMDGWEWSMKDHIKLSVLYKNSIYSTGKDDNKPFKNITRPILNLQYRAEGFDVKDIVLYVDDPKQSHKSFLINGYHGTWARKNKMDTFIDDLVESYVDFGGALIKNVDDVKPEVVPLQSIAFCDQTDILSGTIGFKLFFSPGQLLEMAQVGWGDEKNGATVTLEELITLAQSEKSIDKQGGKKAKTPGKYIEIYEVHGNMPEKFLGGERASSDKYVDQMQIVAFYKKENGEKQGVYLFRGKEKESIFKFIARDKIYGRALGFGGAEELFEPQVWTNYDILRIKGLLDQAAKVIYKTTDSAFVKQNDTRKMKNGQTLLLGETHDIGQLDTTPKNIGLFEKSMMDWEQHAQTTGSAQGAIMGEKPNAGTPFALQELLVNQSQGQHDYRKGKIATFVDEIYADWIIPHITKEIVKEQTFTMELSLEDMQKVSKLVVGNQVNNYAKEHILNGEIPDREALEAYKEQLTELFMSGGNKKFFKILEDEMKDAPVVVKTNISGKQAYLAEKVQKLVNVFRQIISNPGVLAEPAMADLFNKILESSGLSPIDFSGIKAPEQTPSPAATVPVPADNISN